MADDFANDDWARAMRGMVYGQGPRSLMDIDPFTGRDKSGAFNIPAGVPMQGAPQGGGMLERIRKYQSLMQMVAP